MPTYPTPAQIRGARGMLDWSMVDLAKAADVSISTLKRIEGDQLQPVSDELCGSVRTALEKAGVRFLDNDGSGPGVRLRQP